ncbi:MAG: IS1634 family transposase, partial [Candidatus Sabulitectum sp.]|nr:IS1634 family transposase [Candidatus Sabulitectum sp.]
GEYDVAEDTGGPSITYGMSKDKRPDLKQFMVELLCVHQNIPILGSAVDGNSSDKKLNHKMLTRMSNHLAKHGIGDGAFVYTADSAMVTEYNLEALWNSLFITRLPFNYKEADLAVSRAVRDKDGWEKVPPKESPKQSRPLAEYKLYETTVTLYGREYRAIVVHSSAHDKRRQKRLDHRLADSVKEVTDSLKKACKTEYFCRADAEAAAERLASSHSMYHSLSVEIEEKITYGKGKPPKDPTKRKIGSIKYLLDGTVNENTEKVEQAREESGCFVLLTNTPVIGEMSHSPAEVLAAYKEQHGIERDFSFIKNPTIMNSVFLKNPERIEVLCFIMLIALLI